MHEREIDTLFILHGVDNEGQETVCYARTLDTIGFYWYDETEYEDPRAAAEGDVSDPVRVRHFNDYAEFEDFRYGKVD